MSSGAPHVCDACAIGLSATACKRYEEKPHNGGNHTYDGPESLAGHEASGKHPDALNHPDASGEQCKDPQDKQNDSTRRHVPHASPKMPP